MSDLLTQLLNYDWELRVALTSEITTIGLYGISTDTLLETMIFDTSLTLPQIFNYALELAETELPDIFISLFSDYNRLKIEQENTLYRIQKDDVASLLVNHAFEQEVTEQFKQSFSCMESVQEFVDIAETHLTMIKNNKKLTERTYP